MNTTTPAQGTSQRPPGDCLLLEFQIMGYQAALELQRMLVDRRKSGDTARDLLLILEHPPVFTVGRSGSLDNLLVGSAFLDERSIEVVRIERGGDITYHGPGQIILYPIIDLRKAGIGMTELVFGLEEIMVRTAADFGVQAERSLSGRGVWVGSTKLGSLGLALRRGITFHGLALNVDLDLTPFTWINPCGLNGVAMTSLTRQARRTVSPDQVRQRLKAHFQDFFHRRLVPAPLQDILPAFGDIHESNDTPQASGSQAKLAEEEPSQLAGLRKSQHPDQ